VDETYKSVRFHLPNARYLFLFDGIHEKHEHLREPYEEYRDTLIARMVNGEWSNTGYLMFAEFTHQAGMVRAALAHKQIHTPLVLWIEHDFYFNGLPIDWQGITNTLLDHEVCYVRFLIPEEKYLEKSAHYKLEPLINSHGVPMMRHIQFSGIPHVATTEFYHRLVQDFHEAKAHLECELTEDIPYKEQKWILAVYMPAGEMPRVSTLDGRRGDPKLPVML
jgi:hypothetical protein